MKKYNQHFQSLYNCTNIRVRIGSQLSEHALINKGVRRGYPRSCVLFNMHMDHIVKKWQETSPKRIKVDLFADNQAVLAKTEDDMQRAVY